MTARLMSLLIWAAVAASAVYWGLRLFVQPTAVPAHAQVAVAPPPAGTGLIRLLGQAPAQPAEVEEEALPADGRFRLLGVVAQRGGAGSGLALISVDGKPPRAVAVGREIEPGLRLLSVSHRQAELGAARGGPAMTLALPALAEAQRGRPGEVPPPGALPGQMPGGGFVPPGGGPPRPPMAGVPQGEVGGMPGQPIQVQNEAQEAVDNQADNGSAPTR